MPIAAVKAQAMMRWFDFRIDTLCFDAIEAILGFGIMMVQTIQAMAMVNVETAPSIGMAEMEIGQGLGIEIVDEVDAVEMTESDTEPDMEANDIDGGACDD